MKKVLAGIILLCFGTGSFAVAQETNSPPRGGRPMPEPADQKLPSLFKFDFGNGKVAMGHTQISATNIYSKETGYGFEPGADVRDGDSITSDKPFYFSAALPEGNYKVTVTLGDKEGESTATIKAELRRLMLEKIHAAPGRFEQRSFIVNIRAPKISANGEVRLKPREKTTEWWNWDEKLTLEFNGSHPSLRRIEIEKVDVLTVFLLGDSTVCDQPLEPWNSWGQMLTRFFKPEVAIANHAESGESLRSSLGARRLDKVLSLMKPGDYLFIQYGHNDMKERGEGVGAFTTYKTDLKRFVSGARAKGGIPVVVTSVNRKTFNAAGIVTNSHGDYPEAVRQVAREENVPLIDLHAMSKVFYEALGVENAGKAFQDPTHHNNYGSYELAKCIVMGIKQNKLELAKHIADDFKEFNPAHPDPVESFTMPASPQSSDVKPLGN